MNDESLTEKLHARDILIKEAGREFLAKYFLVTQKDSNDGILDCVGEINLAANYNFQGDIPFNDLDLINSIYALIKNTSWQFNELLLLSIRALIKRQFYYASMNFFANSNKTFLGFIIETNPHEKNYLIWKRFIDIDHIGVTGNGILESLRIAGNSGVSVPGMMFDLCYLIINLENEKNKNLMKFNQDQVVIPGDVLPYKVCDIETEKPFLLNGDYKTELRKIYGINLNLTCAPERMQWFGDQEKNVIEFGVTNFEIGAGGYSDIGRNQFFTINNDQLIAVPIPKSFRCLCLKDYINEKKIIANTKGETFEMDSLKERDSNFIGYASLQYSPNYQDDLYTFYSETYLTICLSVETFEILSTAIRQGQVDHLSIRLNIWIDSVFTSSDKYGGHASDIIFNNIRQGDGEIANLVIDYKI